MDKNYTVVADLTRASQIDDDNIIIVEDAEDTKQATVLDLKKSFTGDYKEPSDKTFYSSQKIESYMDNIRRDLSTFTSDKDFKSLSTRVENLIVSAGKGLDPDVIEAKDGQPTLNARLERDISYAEDMFMEKVNRTIEGTQVSTGNFGYANISVFNLSGPATLYLKSKNKLNTLANTNKADVVYSDNGFTYTQKDVNSLTVTLKITESLPKGKYYFFASIAHDDVFKDKSNIKLAVKNTKDDSAYTEFVYDQSGNFVFDAPKAFNEIKIIFNADKFLINSSVEFKNIMLMTDDKYKSTYIPFESRQIAITASNNSIRGYNNDYDFSCSDKSAIIKVSYYDKEITSESLLNDIKELQDVLLSNHDKCGLIENYGNYLFFDNVECETPTTCRLSYDDNFKRNGVPSLKMEFAEDVDVNPLFKMEMKEYIENIDSVSLVFYIDRTVYYYFNTQEPITIYMCSDSYTEPEMVNYLSIKINKDELIQGWNIIKKNINEFASNGVPNVHGIKYLKLEVAKNASLDNMSMYLNSIIFNQKMKPTVLLAFDGIYEDGVEYTYPYLTNRNIPATILCNNRSTFSSSVLNTIVDLRARYGWDIGQYGCNPDKEKMTYDDNPREQYLALKNTKEWLQNNLIFTPVSYSAPYGNLRPISVPILKDLGFKIAKAQSTGYCNFFDPRYDFAIPMQLFSNETTEEEIINRIQYAIDNGCCICLYTNNVTNYGDEAASKKILLENIIKFILNNKITPMTLSDFYNKCNS